MLKKKALNATSKGYMTKFQFEKERNEIVQKHEQEI